MNVFNRDVKRVQRDKLVAQVDLQKYDYLKLEIARRMADRVLDIKRQFPVVVDVGCGNRYLSKFLGNKGSIETLIQLDLSPKMLMHNAFTPRDPDDPGEVVPSYRKEYCVVADEEYLPIKPGSVDMVISSMSMHWVNDLPGLLRQIRLALKPDGVFIGAMLGGETLQELRSAFALADLERLGGVTPHVSPFARLRDMGDLLTSAGFTLPAADSDVVTVPYPDMFTLMEHLKGMGENMATVDGCRPVSRDAFLAASAAFESMYTEEDGAIPVTFEVLYMVGWAPDASQAQPKARGSAKHSLAAELDK
eukprot:CAMPEP_0175149766 /NCGR_PEP_ID=MMETSP0087-20121206/17450_1 /TAXON_ID=136419 /ORGANISM="Unknown Unknown, Strain D1" /LENGTH=305 /DNA_ID=CAMNT_0016435543 /DNA_START=75 /DNA_END=992 /DNA_ORIENTATION=+